MTCVCVTPPPSSLLLQPFQRHARAAWARRSASSRVGRHWSGMTSPAVKTIEPTSPVTVSSHARRGSEWHTLRRDASGVSQALPLVYLSVCIHVCQSCASLPDDPGHIKTKALIYFILLFQIHEQAGKLFHIWIYITASRRAPRGCYRHEDRPPHMNDARRTASVDVSNVCFKCREFMSPSLRSACPLSSRLRRAQRVGRTHRKKSHPKCLYHRPCVWFDSRNNPLKQSVLFTAAGSRSLILIVGISGGLYYLWRP